VVKKICLVGAPHSGKTALLERYIYNRWHAEYLPTMAPKVTRSVATFPMPERIQEIQMQMMVWDFPQVDKAAQRVGARLRGASGVLALVRPGDDVVGDLGRLRAWIHDHEPAAAVLGVLSHFDEANLSEAHLAQLESQLAPRGIQLVSTSAKTGQGVRAAFLRLGEAVVRSSPI